MNILIWPGLSVVGLEIAESLRNMKNIKLFCGSSEVNHPLTSMYEGVVFLPNLKEGSAQPILSALEGYVVFPAHDYVLDFLAREEMNLQWIGSKSETINLTRSKSQTYDFLQKSDSAELCPTMYKFNDLLNLNEVVYAKPDHGYGSQGHFTIAPADLSRYTEKDVNGFVVTELLSGEEFTIECFTNFEGELLYSNARRRSRIRMGTSLSFEDPSLTIQEIHYEIAVRINTIFEFNGPWYFQTKANSPGSKAFKILEISTRLPGSSVWSRAKGVNLSELAVWNFQRKSLEVVPNENEIHVERDLTSKLIIKPSYSCIYIDLDETILISGKINHWAVAFLTQEKNKGKSIHLITKSLATNLTGLLESHGIMHLFASVNHLKLDENKADFILSQNSIFIDDSHKERANVRNTHGISCYGPDVFQLLVI